MTDYKIYRWDAVILGKQNQPQPMIYIKPNGTELDDKLGNIYSVSISETNSVYDKLEINGILSSSECFPNYRPDFFKQFGYYVIALDSYWNGYPSSSGIVTINGLDLYKSNPPSEQEQKQEQIITSFNNKYLDEPKKETFKNEFIFILTWFAVSLFYFYLRKNLIP